MESNKRPTSVTVVGWIILLLSVLVVLITLMSLHQVYLNILQVWAICGGIIGSIAGVAILKGFNWGRLLYLWVTPISIILESLILGFKPSDIVRGALYIVILLFLVNPSSLTYFGVKNKCA